MYLFHVVPRANGRQRLLIMESTSNHHLSDGIKQRVPWEEHIHNRRKVGFFFYRGVTEVRRQVPPVEQIFFSIYHH